MGNSLSLRDGNIYLVSGSVKKSIGQSGPNTDSPFTASIQPNLSGSEYKSSITLDPLDNSSFIISGSNPTSSFYMSSSGKFGFGTTDPLVSFDIRSDEFQIQKQGKRQGIKVNEEGNLESFNSETDAAATGSEFILSYTRGGAGAVTAANLRSILGVSADEITKVGSAALFFQRLSPREQDKILFLLEREGGNIDKASVGDVLGSIRWIATSGSTDTQDSRTAGEAATIQAVVNASNKFGTSADLIFKVADKAALEGASSDLGKEAAPKTALLLDGDFRHELTGSLTSTGNIIAPNITADSSSFSTRVTANDAKVSMVLGTNSKTALAGNTTTISPAQANILQQTIVSSSAQIASDISGSFVAASGSFSTRVTANDAKTGISTAQASAITANTAKVSSPFPAITTKQEDATITISSITHTPAASEDLKDTLNITVQIIAGKTKTLKSFTLNAN